jgi:hypothetical protein
MYFQKKSVFENYYLAMILIKQLFERQESALLQRKSKEQTIAGNKLKSVAAEPAHLPLA